MKEVDWTLELVIFALLCIGVPLLYIALIKTNVIPKVKPRFWKESERMKKERAFAKTHPALHATIIVSIIVCISSVILDLFRLVLGDILGDALTVRKYSFALAMGLTYYIAYKFLLRRDEQETS